MGPQLRRPECGTSIWVAWDTSRLNGLGQVECRVGQIEIALCKALHPSLVEPTLSPGANLLTKRLSGVTER